MRQAFRTDPSAGASLIDQVVLDLNCRHELVPVLAGLQQLYRCEDLLQAVPALIERDVLGEAAAGQGAPGMSYWEILVLAAVRHGCGLDWDALEDLANNHRTLRAILGLGEDSERGFARSTLHENVGQIRTETIRQISRQVVEAGHRLVPEAAERVRTDGWVVETNIHYPTDAHLMLDGLVKILTLIARLARPHGLRGWRQWQHLLYRARRLHRDLQRAARGKDRQALQAAYEALLEYVRQLQQRAQQTLEQIQQARAQEDPAPADHPAGLLEELTAMLCRTQYACQLAQRRVLEGEKIPNDEKLLSVFEPHTQLYKRGKASEPMQLGRLVVITQDQVGFILQERALAWGQQEAEVAVPILEELQAWLSGRIKVASFDQGFYRPQDWERLLELVETVAMKKKGRPRRAEQERRQDLAFQAGRRWHPGIESAIHALEVGNGLDRCPDRGEVHFHRYVALAVLGRNLQVLGELVLGRRSLPAPRRAA